MSAMAVVLEEASGALRDLAAAGCRRGRRRRCWLPTTAPAPTTPVMTASPSASSPLTTSVILPSLMPISISVGAGAPPGASFQTGRRLARRAARLAAARSPAALARARALARRRRARRRRPRARRGPPLARAASGRPSSSVWAGGSAAPRSAPGPARPRSSSRKVTSAVMPGPELELRVVDRDDGVVGHDVLHRLSASSGPA